MKKKQKLKVSQNDFFALLGFILRAKILIVGRQRLNKSKSDLQFIWITEDLSENSEKEILNEFKHYPVVKYKSTEDFESYFNLNGTKIIGFKKSDLSSSVYKTVKNWRVNGF
jgi:hypothetical protein